MVGNAAAVSGALQVGRKVTLDFTGPFRTENPATFSDFRLTVSFTHAESGRVISAPGFFAADGDSRESSATAGDIWRVHFRPDEPGIWRYSAIFRQGAGVAVATERDAGAPAGYIDGAHGKFPIAPVLEKSRAAKPARKRSSAEAASGGSRAFDGEELVFVRDPQGQAGGSLSFTAADEALDAVLACGDFDNTVDVGRYAAYERHWAPSDPVWSDGRGKAVIGAVNAMASRGANQLRVSIDASGGAAKAAPWARTDLVLGPVRDAETVTARVFDVSKLDQWEAVLEHMTANQLGIRLALRDSDGVARRGSSDHSARLFERKLFLRELAARFGHHAGLCWSLDRSLSVDADMADELLSFIRTIDGRGAAVDHCDLDEEDLRVRHQERRGATRALLETKPPRFNGENARTSRAAEVGSQKAPPEEATEFRLNGWSDTQPTDTFAGDTFAGDAFLGEARPSSNGFSLPSEDFPESWTGRREADPSVRAKSGVRSVSKSDVAEDFAFDCETEQRNSGSDAAFSLGGTTESGTVEPRRRPVAAAPATSAFDLSKYNDAPKTNRTGPQRSGRIGLSLFLIETEGDSAEISPLEHNARLSETIFQDLSTSLAVEARGAAAILASSAKLTLDDGDAVLVAEFAPFAVFSHGDTELFGADLAWGAHTLTVEAFDGPNCRGAVIGRHVQAFNVFGREAHAPARANGFVSDGAAAGDGERRVSSQPPFAADGERRQEHLRKTPANHEEAGPRPIPRVVEDARRAAEPEELGAIPLHSVLGAVKRGALKKPTPNESLDLVDPSEIYPDAPVRQRPDANAALAQRELVIRAMGDAMRRRRSRTRAAFGESIADAKAASRVSARSDRSSAFDELGVPGLETVRFGEQDAREKPTGENRRHPSPSVGAKAAAIAAAATEEALMSLLLVDVESGDALGSIDATGGVASENRNGRSVEVSARAPDRGRSQEAAGAERSEDAFDALFRSRANKFSRSGRKADF